MNRPDSVFFSALLVILLGVLLRRFGVVKREHGATLARLVLNLTLPALVLQTVPQIQFTPELLFLPLLSLGHTALAYVVTRVVFRRASRKSLGLILIASMGFNNGLFAFPIVLEIWGIEAIKLLALFDLGNGITVLGSNYVVAEAYGRETPMRMRETLRQVVRTLGTSVPLLAFMVGLVMNLAGLSFPPGIDRAVSSVAAANGALALIVLGVFQTLTFERGDLAVLLKVLGLRYLLGIGCSVAAIIVFSGAGLLQQVLAIAFILPVGMTIIPYAVQFGLDTRLATTLVNVSIVISFILMWVVVLVT